MTQACEAETLSRWVRRGPGEAALLSDIEAVSCIVRPACETMSKHALIGQPFRSRLQIACQDPPDAPSTISLHVLHFFASQPGRPDPRQAIGSLTIKSQKPIRSVSPIAPLHGTTPPVTPTSIATQAMAVRKSPASHWPTDTGDINSLR